MPNKKNYPVDFSPYYCPSSKPVKPRAEIVSELVISSYSYEGVPIKIKDIPKEAESIEVEFERDYGENNIVISFTKTIKKPNPNYQTALIKYKEDYKKWIKVSKEYKVLKERWDKELEEEAEKRELHQYEKLKEKFEKKI